MKVPQVGKFYGQIIAPNKPESVWWIQNLLNLPSVTLLVHNSILTIILWFLQFLDYALTTYFRLKVNTIKGTCSLMGRGDEQKPMMHCIRWY